MTTCELCRFEDSAEGEPPGGWVARGPRWAVRVPHDLPYPGWLVVQARRHVESIADLDPQEAATFGPTVVTTSRAITEVTGAERVYLLVFGENQRHFHALLAARTPEIPQTERGPALIVKRLAAPPPDLSAIHTVAGQIRKALSEGEARTVER